MVAGALARDPGDRPSSAYTFAFDLSRAATEVFGPNWIPRSGVPVHVDHDLMAATGMAPSRTRHAGGIHVTPLPAEPGTPPQPPGKVPEGKLADPAPGDRAPGKAPAHGKAPADGNTPSGAGRDPAEPEAGSRGRARCGARRSPGRRLIVTAAVLGRPDGARLLGHPLGGHTEWALSAVFSQDGLVPAAAGDDSTVVLWQLDGSAAPRRLERGLVGPGRTAAAAFSPRGRVLALGSDDGVIRLWDLLDPSDPRRVGRDLAGHRSRVWSLSFAPDGHTLASGSHDKTVRLWSMP